MAASPIPDITLSDGHTIPAVVFGTFKMNGREGVDGMVSAIRAGYLGLDSAFNYENEGAVGEAMRRSGVSRADLRVASKLPGRRHAYNQAIVTIEESLYRAQLDYYDLYLIHWPNPSQDKYVDAWRALIEAQKRGMIRSIGVCNFLPEHLQRLIDETGVTPAINQIEMHPYFPQDEQRAWNAAHGIVTEAWSPLGRASTLLSDSKIQSIADAVGRSIPQVILRWHHQLDAIPLPKSSTRERQIENRSIFDFVLSPDQMATIATLARPDGRTHDQDPARYEEM
ncbi:2,5-diketo-D-gluconate reductase [Ameyamaea chiangmaiensis NBRC 103196]|uniref:Aldo/keto reductase n=1 Tax=Ameyamaea chiangmaiensis TaxID=442969 RepID=A0A850PJV4_9PROT|nr:aldo/keto reductase [Ameyamaea chiangmaiensis]MBS4074253.1 aldo/keto reductase [Ameyamaea chiangmaiensis]NVN41571.1 aldo/keto reductase [Ameyamaea chiangmaiensis]GBQ71385.1 2,5-diketo-D-gluconate reductase [Ameyamaea chiangmaiensis NBRC 103196]